jgi:hypothetical protein
MKATRFSTAFAAVLAASCGGISDAGGLKGGISVSVSGARTFAPAFDAASARYEVSCTSGSSRIDREILPPAESTGAIYLDSGTWTVTVAAYNATGEDEMIGEGHSSVEVRPGA